MGIGRRARGKEKERDGSSPGGAGRFMKDPVLDLSYCNGQLDEIYDLSNK